MKYAFEKSLKHLTFSNIESFIYDAKTGILKQALKSAPIPKNNNGPVKIVVGTTFEEIVKNSKKEVLIAFVTPTCEQCQHLKTILLKLAKRVKSKEDLIIAELDIS